MGFFYFLSGDAVVFLLKYYLFTSVKANGNTVIVARDNLIFDVNARPTCTFSLSH